jgi:hypothetical protein
MPLRPEKPAPTTTAPRTFEYNERVCDLWDARNAASNLKKHGIPFDEAATAFDDKLSGWATSASTCGS